MLTDRLEQLDDATLLRSLDRIVAQDRNVTAQLLAHLAEVDARRLYLDAACPSMHLYCVQRLHFSDSSAYSRIRAARTARRFPRLLREVAEGRIHLAAICVLATHLTHENVDELVAAAAHCTKDEIEVWLARRFAPSAVAAAPAPRGRVVRVRTGGGAAVAPAASGAAPPAEMLFTAGNGEESGQGASPSAHGLLPGGVHVQSATPGTTAGAAPNAVAYIVHLPIDDATHAVLREVQALLGHSVAPGDVVAVFKRALGSLRKELHRRKAGRTERPREEVPRRLIARSRRIPAATRRAVWARDEGQCTYRSADDQRCSSRWGLEFDHVVPFARGGESSVEGLRLRCRAHNQFEAERAFGPAFMAGKRRRAGKGTSIGG